MSVTESSVIQTGTRVRVRRGDVPVDATLLGREGVVLAHSPYSPSRVEVSLDGESEIRIFTPSELELLRGPEALPPDQQAARKRLARP
jgi:hypothetical protein